MLPEVAVPSSIPAQLVRVVPDQGSFDPVEVGRASRLTVSMQNLTSVEVGLDFEGISQSGAGRFTFDLPRPWSIRPGGDFSFQIFFRPRDVGVHRKTLCISASTPSQRQVAHFELTAEGMFPRQGSYIQARAEREDAGKQKSRPFLVVSNRHFLNSLRAAGATQFRHYLALPATTEGDTVTIDAKLRAGEVLVPPSRSLLDKPGILCGFYIQAITCQSTFDVSTNIEENGFRDEAERALMHGLFNPCSEGCGHCLTVNPPDTAIQHGEIIEVGSGNLLVVLSPPVVTEHLRRLYRDNEIAFAAPVTYARPGDATDRFRLRADSVTLVDSWFPKPRSRAPSVFVRTYLCALQHIGRARRTGFGLHSDDTKVALAQVIDLLARESA